MSAPGEGADDPSELVNVVGPDGRGGTVDRAHLPGAIARGYKLEDPAATHERQLEADYGDSPITAGAEGLARGATFGLSDYALQALGVSKEGLREREARNPTAAGIGNVGGAILPAVLTGGESVAGEAAAGLGESALAATPAALSARAGAAAAKAASDTAFVSSLAEGGTLARAAARAIPAVAQGVTEGALMGAGQGVSNIALSENPMSAEAIVSELGSQALYGAGFGGAAGTLGAVIGEAGRVARKYGSQVLDHITASAQAAETARLARSAIDETAADTSLMDAPTARKAQRLEQARLTGEASSDVADLREAQRGEMQRLQIDSDSAHAAARDELTAKIDAETETLQARQADLGKQVAQELKDWYQTSDATLTAVRKQLPKTAIPPELQKTGIGRKLYQPQRALDNITGDLASLAESPGDALRPLRRQAQRMSDFVQILPNDAMSSLIEQNRALQQRVSEAAAPISSPALTQYTEQLDALKTARTAAPSDYFHTLENRIQEIQSAAPSSARLTSLQDRLSTLSAPPPAESIGGLLTKNLAGKAAGGALGMLFGHGFVGAAIGDGLQTLVGKALRGELAGSVLRVTQALEAGAASAMKVVARVQPAASAMRAFTKLELAPGASPAPPNVAHPRDDAATAAFRAHSATIAAALSNPAAIAQQIHDNLAGIRAHDPQLAQQVEQKAMQRLQFLGDVLPKAPQMGTPTDGFSRYAPPASDLHKAAQAFAAVEDPTRILRDFAAGRLSMSAVNAVKTVYPQMYGKMQQHVLEHMTSLRKELPYGKRVQLTMMFGAPADTTLRPAFIRSTQQGWAALRAKSGVASGSTVRQGKLGKAIPTSSQQLSSPQ